jgi:hypothetical protein
MLGCERTLYGRVIAAVASLAVAVADAGRDGESDGRMRPARGGAAGDVALACADDSLRPTVAAPAAGLWVDARPRAEGRVAVLIGPPRSDDRALAVVHQVESVEVGPAGDTLRTRLDTALVHLELLPPPGAAEDDGSAAPRAGAQPAATYTLSPRVRVAAYEPCITSSRGPRVRYLRRDARGRTITDVMLRRTSSE